MLSRIAELANWPISGESDSEPETRGNGSQDFYTGRLARQKTGKEAGVLDVELCDDVRRRATTCNDV